MKLIYEREIIVPTGDYKNQRIRMGAQDDFDLGATSIEDAFKRLTAPVDRALADRVVSLKRRLREQEESSERRTILEQEGFDQDDIPF